jgi:glycosyltransferase involved in cell wall biosynthesis
LRVLNAIQETAAPYHQFSLPVADQHTLTLCSYFEPTGPVSAQITLFSGDDSLKGFLRALRTALQADHYEVIHVHSSQVAFLMVLFHLLRLARYEAPTVYTVHTSYPNLKARNRFLTLVAFVMFHRIVFVSHASYASFPSLFRKIAGWRATVIQNGVDIDRIDRAVSQEGRALSTGSFTVVAVGRLIALKNPLSILEAFHRSGISDSCLIFIGDGVLKEELITRCQTLGLTDQVIITGLLPRDEVYRQLHSADLFVSASQVEGLPLAVLEAMACRCPVLLSDIPSHREIARTSDFIPVVPVHDVNSLAGEIKRLRAMTLEQRTGIGEKCRRIVEEHFNLTMMHKKYEEVFLQMVYGEKSSEMQSGNQKSD